MREVLAFAFNAATDSLLVTVAAVKESEHVEGVMVRQLGMVDPSATFEIEALPDEHKTAFRNLLGFLLDATEEKHAELANDPNALAAKASELAVREQRLREEEKASAALSAAIEEKRRALAELDAALDVKRRAASPE